MNGEPDSPNKQNTPGQITFHYIKSNFFRVIHADGAFGGTTPRGQLQIEFWSERQPIPKSVVLDVTKPEMPEFREARVQRKGFVREVEAGIVMDLDTAEVFAQWLLSRIADLKELREGAPKNAQGHPEKE